MKYIDAEKFNQALSDIENAIKPNDLSKPLVSLYWSSVTVTLLAVKKAVEASSVDVQMDLP